jgi:hypothetical protein
MSPQSPGLDRLSRLVRQDVSAKLDREHVDMKRLYTNPRLRYETEALAVGSAVLLLFVFALFVALR